MYKSYKYYKSMYLRMDFTARRLVLSEMVTYGITHNLYMYVQTHTHLFCSTVYSLHACSSALSFALAVVAMTGIHKADFAADDQT